MTDPKNEESPKGEKLPQEIPATPVKQVASAKPTAPVLPALEIESEAAQEKKLEKLEKLAGELFDYAQKTKAQHARDAAYFEALAKVEAATNAVILAQTAPAPKPSPVAALAAKNDPRGCASSCECHSAECCTYSIRLRGIRVGSWQNEPGDSFLGSMEIQLFAHLAGGPGMVIPGFHSTLSLQKPFNSPALWTSLDVPIVDVTVPHNASKSFLIMVEASEIEHTVIENILYWQDEQGTACGTLTLNCCCPPPEIRVELPFTAGGVAMGNRGSIELIFTAVKKCD